MKWCAVCGTRHRPDTSCPGDLRASGPEHQGWRVNVETPRGIEAYGVLVAPAEGGWRARILTYPNVLWTVPGGRTSMKFVAADRAEAERQAIRFIETHCGANGFRLRGSVSGPAAPTAEQAQGAPGRKIRFLPLLFGPVSPTEPGGTANLSDGGLFVITHAPLNPGDPVRMLLRGAESRLELAGRVRWTRREPYAGRSPGMGVQIEDPPRAYLDFVRDLG